MTLKELRLRRIRHGIRAQEMADSLGTSRSWVYQLENYYRGPSLPRWRERYETALQERIAARRQAATGVRVGKGKGGEE
jgi:transcriptional regulator with XRE-family HTH domain